MKLSDHSGGTVQFDPAQFEELKALLRPGYILAVGMLKQQGLGPDGNPLPEPEPTPEPPPTATTSAPPSGDASNTE